MIKRELCVVVDDDLVFLLGIEANESDKPSGPEWVEGGPVLRIFCGGGAARWVGDCECCDEQSDGRRDEGRDGR